MRDVSNPNGRRPALAAAALVPFCIALALAVSACQKSGAGYSSNTATPGTSQGQSPSDSVKVSRIDLGTSVGNDNEVTDKTDSFQPNQTVYASVVTNGNGSGSTTEIKTRFLDPNGQVVDESTRTIAPGSGQTVTEFHVSKPDGFAAGKYKVEVFLNGAPAKTKDFEVKHA